MNTISEFPITKHRAVHCSDPVAAAPGSAPAPALPVAVRRPRAWRALGDATPQGGQRMP